MANPQSTFPALPPSLSAGDDRMRDDYAAQDVPRPAPHTAPEVTPYLGLRARLSQIWINRWSVLIFLILIRVLIAIAGLNHDLGSAKQEALSACTAVEDAGSAMASMPHFMSKGVNELTATGVEKAVAGLKSMLLLTITGVEEIIIFWINMLTQTYLCLITLVVSGALHAAIALVEDVTGFLDSTLNGIVHDIGAGVADIEKGLNGFLKGINSIPAAFGAHTKPPSVNFDDTIKKLEGVHIDANFTSELSKLNSSIPTFGDVNNFTQNVMHLPFDEVKKLINGSLGVFNFNRSLLPVPEKQQLTFCTDNNDIENFFQHLANVANDARKAFIAFLVIAAIAVCIPMTWREIRRWRTMQQRAQLVGDKSYDPVDVIYIASRPYTSWAGIKAATPFRGRRRQLLTRWTIAYATSTPALMVLSLGITGLLACLCQFILLKAVEKEAPAVAADIGAFSGKVIVAVNDASAAWATGTNKVITDSNDDINHNILGWVNTTTGALNKTLNVFVDETTGVLNKTFGGTILQEPVNELFNCLIGLKVAGIEKGLTWVSDHAHVDFPLLDNSTFSLDHLASKSSDGKSDSFLSNPGQATGEKVGAAVNAVGQHIADAIRTEALISMTLVLVWVIIVLMGLGRAIWLSTKPEKVRGEGGVEDIIREAQQHEDQQHVTRAGIPEDPSPAYEPPKQSDRGLFGQFRSNDGPDAHPEPPTPHSARTPRAEEFEDEKLGYGGDRGHPNLSIPDRSNPAAARRSEHGLYGVTTMEKNPFNTPFDDHHQ